MGLKSKKNNGRNVLKNAEYAMEDAVENAANKLVNAPISPVHIAKKCEKQMKRSKMVGAGKQYAPTLYTILVNAQDDIQFTGYYPTLAGETETYLTARARDMGYKMDGKPLVRFIVEPTLKSGKFDVIAECVASPIVERLRREEMEHYGIAPRRGSNIAPVGYDDVYATVDDYDDDYDDGFGASNGYDEYAEYDDYDDGFGGFDAPASIDEEPDGMKGFDVEGDEFGASAAASASAAPAAAASAAAAAGFAVPSPLAAHPAMLRDLSNGRTHRLSASSIKIGRETDNDIEVADMGASRNHCVILNAEGSWTITDCNSLNGTFVNGREITSKILNNGDVITIGTTKFQFIEK